jgi:hypothetical protein
MTDWGALPQWVTACIAGGALGVAIISITSHSQNCGRRHFSCRAPRDRSKVITLS